MLTSRRTFTLSLLLAITTYPWTRLAAQSCEDVPAIAYLVPLSGPLSESGQTIVNGANNAIAALSGAGCRLQVIIVDTGGSLSRLFEAAERIVNVDNVGIIVGGFGEGISEKIAHQFQNVVFIDIFENHIDSSRLPRNYFSLPLKQFYRLTGGRREEALAAQGQTSLELIAAANRIVGGDSAQIINALNQSQINTSRGDFLMSDRGKSFTLRTQ